MRANRQKLELNMREAAETAEWGGTKTRKAARSWSPDSSGVALGRVKRAKKSDPGRLDGEPKAPRVTRRKKVTVRKKRSSKGHIANDDNDVLATAAASAGITGEDIDEGRGRQKCSV
ncbi:hypothetical protein FOZ63_026713 [Perkinsus olseni]|uniref:Uncharacterized protein n=1 Tax=Perkinsus olseni TaxID=32597 RepID=A0A7J6Q886_PEROL|nr:hypothetical protein FOZ62_029657 [Perkinsus olseni]KAF4704769.1 hypothetical protein FOZ63_026713 [Perkinsus olseni]